MWEEDGWEGIAESFGGRGRRLRSPGPALAKWWAKASEFRSGGFDRIVVPAPWTRTIEQLCADGVRGDVYAHELVKVRPGSAVELLERAREQAAPVLGEHGWELVGAFTTAMVDDDEAILLWAIPTWAAVGHRRGGAHRRRPPRDLARRPRDRSRPGTGSCWSTPRCPVPHRPPAVARRPHRLGGLSACWAPGQRFS